jgi:hypothetical protein
MLHSYPRLHKLIRQAGFEGLKPYWAVPDTTYRMPREIIPADGASIRAARKQRGFKHASYTKAEIMFWLTPSPLVKYVTSSLTFFARKPA